MKPRLAMYIVMRADISPTAAMIAYGHATLGTYLTFQHCPLMQEWLQTSFVKRLLSVPNKAALDLVKGWGEHRVFTESTMDNIETCIGFNVVEKPDNRLKDLERYTVERR